MNSSLNRRAGLRPVAGLISVAMLLLWMTLAAACVAAIIYLVRSVVIWPWYGWLVAAPALYVGWLLTLLGLLALTTQVLGRRYPKPQYRGRHPAVRGEREHNLGLLTAWACYRRYAQISTLPLVRAIEQTGLLGRLVMRAYSPSLKIGEGFINWGYLYDPDLTEVGDDVVIGARASVSAHTVSTRDNGEVVYVSAPVKIGNRVTIGGESRIALGCEIGDDAVVEPGSVVAPFTRIPAAETWGGNPARFRRRRDDPTSLNGAALDAAPGASAPAVPVRLAANGAGPALDGEIRQLVVEALGLDANQIPPDLSSQTCADWDSLGQIAIAAAIFDRYGIAVHEDDIHRIRTLHDIEAVISGVRLAGAEVDEALGGMGANEPHPTAVTANGVSPSLPDDLEMLPLLDPQDATRLLATRFQGERTDGEPVRVVVASTFTAQPLAASLRLWGRAFGFEIDCRFADYDQITQALLDESGPFEANPDGVNVVLARPEDLISDADPHGRARLDQITAAIGQYAAGEPRRSKLLVGTLPPAVSVFTLLERQAVDALRHEWSASAAGVTGVELFDFAGVVERWGIAAARNSTGEALSRAPYSPGLYQELGIALLRQIRAGRRSPAKVIAVDCDNTLWGGVVGEAGLEGIELGPDGPGRAYQLFQRQLKQLKERGLLLVVVSKNEEPDVLDVFERHSGMVLKPDDIAMWKVNWNHKSENLRELADEMNLGIDSFVFLDDDPVVRLEVQSRLPEVHVVPLPQDPSGYCETLGRLWLFDGAAATDADRARTRMMQEEGRRQRDQKSAASLEEFLASLDLRVELRSPNEGEWSRVAQLTQRTNQFNSSLKRRTVEEVRALARESSVLVMRAEDRFGDYGLVGLAILRPPDAGGAAEIDTLLMSCRALGRGVEDAILYGMAEMASRQGATSLVVPFVEGPRNAQVLDYLRRSGFVEVEPGVWRRSIVQLPPLPGHVTLKRPEPVQATTSMV